MAYRRYHRFNKNNPVGLGKPPFASFNPHTRDAPVLRNDNMIIVSGENIYPSEIENHIYKFKGINLGIVSSIPDRLTQNKMIFLYESKNLINYNTFYNFFKSKISRHKIPKKIIHVSEIGIKEIPKASNKKILRKKVKDLLKKKLFK